MSNIAQLRIPKFQNTQRELLYSDFSSGLNYRDNASLIKPSQTPECQNVRVRDGTVNKRPGFKRLYANSLGTGKINGLFQYKKANGASYKLIVHGDKLYNLADIDL